MTPLKFNGSGSEYFKIWIVNILLTIITLGLYRPWAKVRTLRYFYGNTELDNANFEYHATGKQLFVSFIIAVALLLVYLVIGQLNPILGLILPIALLIALPWIIWRSMKFNLSMSSYRNVRFGFNGELSGSYIVLLAYPIGMLLAAIGAVSLAGSISFWLAALLTVMAYPAYIAMTTKVVNSYIFNGIHFGQGKVNNKLEFKPFLIIFLKATGISLLLALAAAIIFAGMAYMSISSNQINSLMQNISNLGQGARPSSLIIYSLIAFYVTLLLISMYALAYTKANQRAYLLNETILDNSITFESTLSTNKYFGVMFTNLLLLVCTLGLAYPWTAIRLYRYSIESVSVQAEQGFDKFISTQSDNKGPLGEELGDAFNADVGGLVF
ncbi:YjgN family protein [Marinomonas sp.]|uniref:YjgN family protein n=1 Tax=Marinomonas sp. TaxID=1904862 RepID=UPI003BA98BB9